MNGFQSMATSTVGDRAAYYLRDPRASVGAHSACDRACRCAGADVCVGAHKRLAVSVIVFWLLLQLSRALRVMRLATQAPVGHVPSAVILHARLQTGMPMMDVVKLTRSLGRKLRDEPETFAWRDESGAEVEIEFDGGRCKSWRLTRPE